MKRRVFFATIYGLAWILAVGFAAGVPLYRTLNRWRTAGFTAISARVAADGSQPARAGSAPPAMPRVSGAQWIAPAVFEKNAGQFNSKTEFYSHARGYALSLERGGIAIIPSVPKTAGHSARGGAARDSPFHFEFLDASKGAEWSGETPLAAHANYFFGRDASRWRTDVPLFQAARARNVAPRIDCVARSGPEGMELDFEAAAGADLGRLRIRLSGPGKIERSPEGDLIVRRGAATLRLRAPSIYQVISGSTVPIGGSYQVESGGIISFRMVYYDRTQPLIIDPSVSLSYTTFLGGSGADSASSVGLDPTGNVYIAGTAASAGFPESTSNAIGLGGVTDFFVAKLNPGATGAGSLVYLTFIGGSGEEAGGNIAVDATTGEVALVGTTTSSDYPVTDTTTLGTSANALVLTTLKPAGNSLTFSTLLKGNGSEGTQSAPSIAFQPSGKIAVAGDTTSTDFPVTSGAYQPIFGSGDSPKGSDDGFLGVYSGTGALAYLTYLGVDSFTSSSVQMSVTGIAVDVLGNAYLAGFTSQPGNGFSTKNGFVTKNGFPTGYGGGAFDGFLMSVSPNGRGANDLVYSTFLGGGGSDQALAVAVDGAIPANAYVVGTTQSNDILTSPAILGFQTTLKGTANGFLAVVSVDTTGATSLGYATYFGGSGSDSVLSVQALGGSAVYVAGEASSPDFPTYQTLQSFSGTSDAFVAKFDTTQAGALSLLYATLLGGRNAAQANGVAATPTGTVFITGATTSPDFPLAGNPQTGAQPVCSSCQESPPLSDAFFVVLAENASTGPIVGFNAPELNFGNQLVGTPNPPQLSILTNSGSLPLTISGVAIAGANAADFSQSSTCPVAPQTLAAGANCQITVTFSPSIAGAETAALSFMDNAAGSPQSVNLAGTGQEPVATLVPAAVAFGNQPINTSNAQLVTLTNSGNLSLNLSEIQLTGPDVAQFGYEQGDTCGNAPVLPNSSCTIGITFRPNATGNYSAQLEFVDNANNVAGGMQTIPITGTGVPPSPAVILQPASLAFAPQIVGTTSGPQTVTLKNSGSLALQISTISMAGSNANQFAFNTGCMTPGGTLPVGASCNVSVTFTPSTTGVQSAAISFADNVSGSPQTVTISGTGVAASLAVSPAGLSFLPETLMVPTAPQNITVANSGTSAVQISGITIGGANSADFTQTSNCPSPGTLNPQSQNSAAASCTISVAFDPVAVGNMSATLFVNDNATGSPQTIALSGVGVVPSVSLSGASLVFAAQLVGTTSAASNIGVTNTGAGGLAISGLTFTGANAADFTPTQNCGKILAPNASCQVSVTFAPAAAGSRSAILNIGDNALNSPQTIPLTGAATDFSMGLPPGGAQAIAVTAGQTATYNLQVSAAGGFAGNVAITCAGAPGLANCAATPAIVDVSGAAPVAFMVNVTTTAANDAHAWPWRAGPRDGPDGAQRAFFLARPFSLIALFGLIAAMAFAHFAVGFGIRGRCPRRVIEFARGFVLVLWLGAMLAACGGGGGGGDSRSVYSAGTPPGNYTLTVTGTNQGVTRTARLTLSVQ